MKPTLKLGIKALTLPVACAMFAAFAHAEQAPATGGAAAQPAPAATTAPAVKPVVPKVDAAKPAIAKPVGTAAAKPITATKKVATVSPCKGLDQKACGGNKACAWIIPKDPNDKTGKLQEPYCRKIAGVALKKPAGAKPATTAAKIIAPPVTMEPAAKTAPAAAAPQTVKKQTAKVVPPSTTTAAVKVTPPPAPAPAQ